MAPIFLLLQAVVGAFLFLYFPESEAVLCYENSDQGVGTCPDDAYLGDGVTDIECCWNIKYSYKTDATSPCQACRPAKWSAWSEWSPCTVSCKEGIEIRRRSCIGQGDCDGDAIEVQACSLQSCCPENGGWSGWSSWSQCSVTCERGTMERTRECNNPPPECGGTCPGTKKEVAPCDTQQICPTHGSWGSWGSWGACSGACITEGSAIFPNQVRQRSCNNPTPSTNPPGNPCTGDKQEIQDCKTLPFCPVHGGWGEWKKVSECSVTCGLGRVGEERVCNNPAPKHGGRGCPGSPIRHILCNTKTECPIDGEWSEWQDWSDCQLLGEDIRCKKRAGIQSRKRECLGTNYGGKWCETPYREGRNCYNVEKCIIRTTRWSEWSPWSLCSASCGVSERTRQRVCEPIYQDYPDTVTTATKVSEVFFHGTPRFQCQPINNEKLKVVETIPCQNVPKC
ncbi:Hypothetical predicted protein [Pelobates cultripes]|uniref:Complement factor properdin n=2 Tax=Pelobates cultripes TaxID=61616 RepID=A0AAD1WQF8_PELCU|nr:Hypothetical predicted protein [Pelobates cultripes]